MARPASDAERPRTAVVAGGAGRLGSAVVDVLLRRGERVCVPCASDADVERVRDAQADALRDGAVRMSRCDVADPDQVAALLDVLEADWGPLWLACSTVGGWAGGQDLAQLDDLTLLERMFRLNVRTAAVVAREGLRHMGPAGGRIVVVSSRTITRPAAGQAAYTAAKAALAALVETLAVELRGTGRTANAVVPGVLDTPENRRALPGGDPDRWVPTPAVARVIAWLASVDAWPVNGALVPVAGDS